MVQGVASEIADEANVARAHRAPLVPWAGQNGRYLRIACQVVSGRRLAAGGARRNGEGTG
jgi:hypothetical protein